MKLAIWGTTVLMWFIICIHVPAAYGSYDAPLELKKEDRKEARIKVVYTEERIVELIREALPPVFVDIAYCEGVKDGRLAPEIVNPTNGSYDTGVFQISMYWHGKEIRELGLDMKDPKDNIAYAKLLYEREGLRPWEASRSCWE